MGKFCLQYYLFFTVWIRIWIRIRKTDPDPQHYWKSARVSTYFATGSTAVAVGTGANTLSLASRAVSSTDTHALSMPEPKLFNLIKMS